MDGNEIPVLLSAPLLTTLLIEVIKWVLRKFILKNPGFDFAPIFYQYTIPLFNAVFGIGLGAIGLAPEVTFEWKTLLSWAISVVITLVLYNFGIKPLKEYTRSYNS